MGGIREIPSELEKPWYEKGLQFDCSGCGKCCINDGEVWMDTEEFVDLSKRLKLSNYDTLQEYSESVLNGWVKIRNAGESDTIEEDRCVFLGNDGKSCQIYKERPAQCRTYPYWPRLLESPETWEEEAVVPSDSIDINSQNHDNLKIWTPEEGGCEGMNAENAPIIPYTNIYRNREMYSFYMDSFPWAKQGDDEQRLLASADMMSAVHKSTEAWVNNFVIKYDLCPFAESVFTSDAIRYRTFLRSERSAIISKIRYEILHLLITPEDECATTLLMLPFAYPDFEDWYAFTTELEDYVLNDMLVECRGGSNDDDNDDTDVLPEIQLATFHPHFQWADLESQHTLNYEKRSPFPTINLLRASRVRDWANEAKTKVIGNNNEQSLADAGEERLAKEFKSIIEIALDYEN